MGKGGSDLFVLKSGFGEFSSKFRLQKINFEILKPILPFKWN
jgi:hypothetical protein